MEPINISFDTAKQHLSGPSSNGGDESLESV